MSSVSASWEARRFEIYELFLRCGRNASRVADILECHRDTVLKWSARVERKEPERASQIAGLVAGQPIIDNQTTGGSAAAAARLVALREEIARLESQVGGVATRQTNGPIEEGGQIDAPPPVTVIYPELMRAASPPPPAVFAVSQFLKVAYVSDVHLPFEDKVNVRVTLDYLADYKPDVVILGGDIWDFYEISDYERDPGRITTLQDEFDQGRYFVKAIDELCARVVMLEGNHEGRLHRLISRNPGLFKLRSLEIPRAAELPERWQYFPSQTHYRLGPMLALHGDVKGMSDRATHPAYTLFQRLKRSCIAGHFHRFGRYYDTDYDGVPRAGFVNGHLSDMKQVKYITSPNWQSGFSTIEMAADGHLFRVDQHIIVNGRMVAGGKEYTI